MGAITQDKKSGSYSYGIFGPPLFGQPTEHRSTFDSTIGGGPPSSLTHGGKEYRLDGWSSAFGSQNVYREATRQESSSTSPSSPSSSYGGSWDSSPSYASSDGFELLYGCGALVGLAILIYGVVTLANWLAPFLSPVAEFVNKIGDNVFVFMLQAIGVLIVTVFVNRHLRKKPGDNCLVTSLDPKTRPLFLKKSRSTFVSPWTIAAVVIAFLALFYLVLIPLAAQAILASSNSGHGQSAFNDQSSGIVSGFKKDFADSCRPLARTTVKDPRPNSKTTITVSSSQAETTARAIVEAQRACPAPASRRWQGQVTDRSRSAGWGWPTRRTPTKSVQANGMRGNRPSLGESISSHFRTGAGNKQPNSKVRIPPRGRFGGEMVAFYKTPDGKWTWDPLNSRLDNRIVRTIKSWFKSSSKPESSQSGKLDAETKARMRGYQPSWRERISHYLKKPESSTANTHPNSS